MTIDELRAKEMNEWNGGIKPKRKKCTTCKKKVVKELEPLVDEIFIPTVDEMKLAFYELTNMKGVIEDKKPFISKVYQSLFNEELDFNCNSCVSVQATKFHNYLTYTLNIKL